MNPETAEKGVQAHIFNLAPNLSMDEASMDKACEASAPHGVRRLARQGVNPMTASQLVQDRDPRAKKALVDEMDERPVYTSRAPVLHKYGITALWPKLS